MMNLIILFYDEFNNLMEFNDFILFNDKYLMKFNDEFDYLI